MSDHHNHLGLIMEITSSRILLFLLITPAVLAEDPFSPRALGSNCDTSYTTTCLKLDIVNFVEKVSGRSNDISILPGLTLVKDKDVSSTEASEKVAELARSFPNDPDSRVDSYLLYKIGSFLDSHSLKFKLMDDETAKEIGREYRYGGGGGGGGGGLGGGKRKGGGKGGMGGLMMMGMMMKGTLGAIAFMGLAALAGKALMTSLLALLLSGVIGLKSLMSGGGHTATYEVVAKPSYSSSHSYSHDDIHGGGYGGHGGYGRSLEVKLPEHLSKPQA